MDTGVRSSVRNIQPVSAAKSAVIYRKVKWHLGKEERRYAAGVKKDNVRRPCIERPSDNAEGGKEMQPVSNTKSAAMYVCAMYRKVKWNADGRKEGRRWKHAGYLTSLREYRFYILPSKIQEQEV